MEKPISMDFFDDGKLFVSSEFLYQILLYQLNSTESRIEIGSSNDDCSNGPASTASITSIYGMSYLKSSDELLFADYYCNAIRSFSPSNSTIQTIAGLSGYESDGFQDGIGTDALFNGPCGISRNGSIIYIAEYTNCAVRRLNLSDMSVTTLAGNGVLGYRNGHHSSAHFFSPNDVITVPSEDESVFVVDSYNNAIRVIKDGLVTTIAGHGSRIYNFSNTVPVSVEGPCSILALDVNNLIIADRINNCIIKAKIGADRLSIDLEVFAGDGSYGWLDGIGTDAMLNGPADMVFNEDRSAVYIADSKNHLIRKLQLSTGELSTFAGTGYEGNEIKPEFLASSFSRPQAITIDIKSGGVLYVADSGNNCIKRINGSAISVWAGSVTAGFKNGVSISALFANPMGIVYDPANLVLYVADTFNHAVRKIDSRRLVSTIVGVNGTSGYIDGVNNLARLDFPTKLCIGRLPNELLMIIDSGNHAVRMLYANQTVSTILVEPDAILYGIALDPMGNLYISDSKQLRVIYQTEDKEVTKEESIKIWVIVVCAFAIVLSILVVWVQSRRIARYRQSATATKTNNIEKLKRVVAASEFASTDTLKFSLSQSRTVQGNKSLSIPGYLEMDLTLDIELEKKGKTYKGGTATVKKGRFKSPHLIDKHGGGIDIAIKYFQMKPEDEAIFLYEIALMSSLPKCPNILQLLGYSSAEKAIVLKFHPGSLDKLIKTRAIPFAKIIKIGLDISNGLMNLHEAKIIHFDIKPCKQNYRFSD